MSTKTLILSSTGLKNLVSGIGHEDDFEFVFGQHKISMKNIFAEFISPTVSKLHQTDPTINCVCFNDNLKDITLSENTMLKFNLLSKGETVTINEEESIEMKIISIVINNEELYCKLTELYSNEINETNIDHYLSKLTFLYNISPTFDCFNYNNIIDKISSQFYSIDKQKLKQIPKPILYSIICNSNLRLENEDSLLDFLNDYFSEEEEETEYIYFYETIEYSMLSETKFEEFIDHFNSSSITHNLWSKLKQCFYTNKSKCIKEVNEKRYQINILKEQKEKIKTLQDSNGIIDYLTKVAGGNVHEKGVVIVTSSSTYDSKHIAKNAVDIHDKNNLFCSQYYSNSWLKYDFLKRKVHPTGYIITSVNDFDQNHPQNWVIEGSNNDSIWVILDSRQGETSLTGIGLTRKFNIKPHEGSYRYLRIRQNGPNSNNNGQLVFSSLEYLGTIS